MSDRLRVKPREGLLIRDPFTRDRIPPEGAVISMHGANGTVIRKHLNAGDLIELPLDDEPKNALRELGVDQRKGEQFAGKKA